MKNTELIALDLDDTLLKHDLSISDYTFNILQKVLQQGIYVVLASGRTEKAIIPFVERLKLDSSKYGRYIVASNGSSIYDLKEKKSIYSQFLSCEIQQEIYELAFEKDLFVEVYEDSQIYVPCDNKWTRHDMSLSGLEMTVVGEYKKFLEKKFPKMVIPGNPDELIRFQKLLQDRFFSEAEIFISKPYFLEVTPKNSGKGQAINFLADYLNLNSQNLMGFGDSMNDESLMRLIPNSVAMCNGLDYIKKLGKYITDFSNEDDGVARFIEKNVFI